jgi:hypothetical protein
MQEKRLLRGGGRSLRAGIPNDLVMTNVGVGDNFFGRFGLSAGEGEPAATSPEVDGVSKQNSSPTPAFRVLNFLNAIISWCSL